MANFGNGDVIKISGVGEVSKLATCPARTTVTSSITTSSSMWWPVARIKFTVFPAGEVELFAGSGKRGHADDPALELAATFSFPNDLVFSPDGMTLYVNENPEVKSCRMLAPEMPPSRRH